MEQDNIDFVITWVDGNDPKWQRKRNQYSPKEQQDVSINRYREWGNLIYLFRGIEKFAPWVHKVYFISDEQVPVWLNINHPKLVLVDHKDYIPEKYLPVFSSRPIDLNLHRIKGLEEKFVTFNDDYLITDYLKPTDFFVGDMPKDIFIEYPIMCGGNSPLFSNTLANTFNLIGKYYTRSEYRKVLKKKILSPKYGLYFWYNLLQYYIPYTKFFGLLTPHFARPYLKSSFVELWQKEEAVLDATCRNRFRDITDVNIYVFRLWNLLKGNFIPANIFKMGKALFIREDNPEIYKTIESQKYKILCLNDDCNEECFHIVSPKIKQSIDKILPEKSLFEK